MLDIFIGVELSVGSLSDGTLPAAKICEILVLKRLKVIGQRKDILVAVGRLGRVGEGFIGEAFLVCRERVLCKIQGFDCIENSRVVDNLTIDLKVGCLTMHKELGRIGKLMLCMRLKEVVEGRICAFVVARLLLDHRLEIR